MGICKEREIDPCRSSVSKIDCWIFFSQKNPLIAARICLIWSNPSLNIRVMRCSCKKVTNKSKSQITDSHEVKLGLEYKSGKVVRWSSKLSISCGRLIPYVLHPAWTLSVICRYLRWSLKVTIWQNISCKNVNTVILTKN